MGNFNCPRCFRTYLDVSSDFKCRYCTEHPVTTQPDCFKEVAGFPNKCLNRGWCFKIFGDKLGCDQNPLNQTVPNCIKITSNPNEGTLKSNSTHRKLEIV